MNGEILVSVRILLLLSFAAGWSTLALAEDFAVQRAISVYLNQQLDSAGYLSTLTDEECQRHVSKGKDESACTYRYAQGAYANVVSSKEDGLFAFQLLMTIPEYNGHDIYRDTMFMFSLLIWGNLARDKEYDEANRFLQRLWNRYVDSDKSELEIDGWRYLISRRDTCIGEYVNMVGVKEGSEFKPTDFLSPLAEFCRSP